MDLLRHSLHAALLLSFASIVLAQNSSLNSVVLMGQPRLFAPGVISTPDFEFNASFAPDGNTVYFSKSDIGYNHITIVLSHRKNGKWTEPEVASFSGVWKDTDPFVSPDGKRLFFASTRPTDGSSTPRKDYDIWFVDRTDNDNWSEPKHLPAPVNTDGNELYPSLTRDGTLYFCLVRTDRPGSHLYRSRLVDGEYAEPELLPFSNQANDLDSTIAADASPSRGGVGLGDLFVSFHHSDGSWSSPKNLGAPINSSFHEIATGLSPDNRTLYFASNRIDAPPLRPGRINYQELENELHAVQNGLMNIYEVDISDLKNLDDGK